MGSFASKTTRRAQVVSVAVASTNAASSKNNAATAFANSHVTLNKAKELVMSVVEAFKRCHACGQSHFSPGSRCKVFLPVDTVNCVTTSKASQTTG
jgi:hypothetical protein